MYAAEPVQNYPVASAAEPVQNHPVTNPAEQLQNCLYYIYVQYGRGSRDAELLQNHPSLH